MPLTSTQIRQFKNEGYLVVEDLIDEESLADWRGQVWRKIGQLPHRPERWPQGRLDPEGFKFDPPERSFGQHRAILPIVEQLGGGAFGKGGGSPIIRFPDPPGEWRLSARGHIDGYPGDKWYPFMLGATTYLYDVEPRGGGFCYWPGSHHATMQYFREHPDQIDHGTRGGQRAGPSAVHQDFPHPPREFTARAGTVIFWHAFLSHEGSPNARPWPRMGVFCRWGRADQSDITREWITSDDPWQYWSDAVQQA